MKSKEEIITEMCHTYRNDYGLDRDPNGPSWVAGMTQEEREGLYRTMSQLYEHHIQPLVEYYDKLKNGEEVVLPKDKDHAEAMVKIGMFYLDQQNGKEKR